MEYNKVSLTRKGDFMMWSIIWLVVFVLLVTFEAATMGLFTIWFAGGALAAFLAYLLGAGVAVQAVLFAAVSVALLVVTRPLAVRFFNQDREKTNAESLIGKTAVVLERIDNLMGEGKVCVEGQEWTARAVDGIAIPQDARVEIMDISGVKLLVKGQGAEIRKSEAETGSREQK